MINKNLFTSSYFMVAAPLNGVTKLSSNLIKSMTFSSGMGNHQKGLHFSKPFLLFSEQGG